MLGVENAVLPAQDNTDAADTTGAVIPAATLPGETSEEVKDSEEKKVDSGLPGSEEGEETPEEKAETGAPEEYAPFDLSAGEDVGYTLTDDQAEEFKAFGKENDLSDKQMQSILNFHINQVRQTTESNEKYITDQTKEGIDASRKKYGDKYSAAHNKNAAVYNRFFPEETRVKLNNYGLSSDPGFFDALNAISTVFQEDKVVKGDGVGQKEYLKYSDLLPQKPKT